MVSDPVEIKKAASHGYGLFAKKQFKKGEKIIKIEGRLVHASKFMKLEKKIRYNSIRFSKDYDIVTAGRLGNFLNHSCDPNAMLEKTKGKLLLSALKKINVGKEITLDYSTITAKDDYFKMKCRCGASNCRKIIETYSKLPNKVLRGHIKNKMIPAYILKIKG